MEVYYNLFLEDAFNILKHVSFNSVDCVITDPPYGVLDNFEWDNIKDIENFTRKWYSLILKVLKKDSAVYVFWSQKFLKEGIEIFNPKRILVWHHPNLAKTTDKMYLYTYDVVFYIERGNPKFHGSFKDKTNVDVFTYSKPQSNWKKEKCFHPACKPVRLIENFVRNSTDKGDVILDPFMGSGTTGVAAVRWKRSFIGFEKEEKYYNIALKRIKEEAKQTKLNVR